MESYKVTFSDRSIEMYRADRMVQAYGEVRLLDQEGGEVASWSEEEIHSIQKVEPREGGGGPTVGEEPGLG